MARQKSGNRSQAPVEMTREAVVEDLRATLAAGHLKPGDRIGAERELAERYGVSRWTVRQALETLQTEGVILKTNGRSGGVFVAPTRILRDVRDVAMPRYLPAGMESGTTILSTQTLPASADVAALFEVPVDTWLYRIERLRLAAGLPFSLETHWFPTDRFPGLLDQSLVTSISEVLDVVYGVQRDEYVETISSAPADRFQAHALSVPQGSPVLLVDRIGRDSEARVFEFAHECYRADRMAVKVVTTGGVRSARELK